MASEGTKGKNDELKGQVLLFLAHHQWRVRESLCCFKMLYHT